MLGRDGLALHLSGWIKDFARREGRKPSKADMPPDITEQFREWQESKKAGSSQNVAPGTAPGNRFIRQPVKKRASPTENRQPTAPQSLPEDADCSWKASEQHVHTADRIVLSPTQVRRGGIIAQERPLAFQHIALLTQRAAHTVPRSVGTLSHDEPAQSPTARSKPILALPPCPASALLGAAQPQSSALKPAEGKAAIHASLLETSSGVPTAAAARDADCQTGKLSSWQGQSVATFAAPPDSDLPAGVRRNDSDQQSEHPAQSHYLQANQIPGPSHGGETTDSEMAQPGICTRPQPVKKGHSQPWEWDHPEDEAAPCDAAEQGGRGKGCTSAPFDSREPQAGRSTACQLPPVQHVENGKGEEAGGSPASQESCKDDMEWTPSTAPEVAVTDKAKRKPPAKRAKPAAGARQPPKRRKRIEEDSAGTSSSSSESDASDCSEEGEEKQSAPAGRRRRGAAGSGRQCQRESAVQHDGGGNGEGADGRGNNAGPKSPAGKKKSAAAKPRQNFVRMNNKGGTGKFGFKSKSGMRNQRGRGARRGGRFGRKFATKWLPQAGDGADYVDGWEPRAGNVCFKCGRAGHWANACPGPTAAQAQEGAENSGSGGEEEAARPVQPNCALPQAATAVASTSEQSPELLQLLDLARAEQSEEALLKVLSSVFGHAAFRVPQLAIIQKVLQGISTLAILPTGAGKSLCYQLPALAQGGTTLVVSPLVALMRDQLSHLPAALPAAMLWRGQSKQEAMQTLADLKEGKLRVLYVAPERLHNVMLLQALAPLLPLPLVVVDEAHCVAEWGHNFRSAYFRLGHMLRQKLPCRAVLALTATATRATQASVMRVLGIPPAHLVREAVMPPNLRLRVQHIREGTGSLKVALLRLVKGGLPVRGATIIVYTTFQSQADEIAGYLYNNDVAAASYHAGKSDIERKRIQEDFCKCKTRVVVATLAFGMGLDAAHVRGVVHLNLPRSLEEYVQQVGRAGRDGAEGHCHLFLSDADFQRLRSLGHAEEVGRDSVGRFLQEVFGGAGAADEENGGRYGVLGVAKLSQQLDAKEEVLETLLSYLEAAEEQYVHVLPPTSLSVKVLFYASDPTELAEHFPVVQALLCVCPKPRRGTYDAPMAAFCNALHAPPSQVLKQLQELAAQDQVRFELSKLNAMAFEVRERPHDVISLATELCRRHTRACRQQVHRLDTAYRTFAEVSAVAEPAEQEALLRERICAYFEREAEASGIAGMQGLPMQPVNGLLRADLRALQLQAQRNAGPQEMPLSGRAAARILHGISSPAFPAKEWSKCGFWGRYTATAFGAVLKAANESC